MSGILDMIAQHVNPGMVGQISNDAGTDPGTTTNAISAALPMLFGAMSRHASTDDGANQIHEAVQTVPADGATPAANPSLLGRILGPNQDDVQNSVAKAAGIDTRQAGKVLMYLAPVAIGILARQHAQQPETAAQPGGLSSMLGGLERTMQGGAGAAGGGLGGMLGNILGG